MQVPAMSQEQLIYAVLQEDNNRDENGMLDLKVVSQKIMDCVKSGMTFQQIETQLREHRSRVYIVARNPPNSPFVTVLLPGAIKCSYIMHIAAQLDPEKSRVDLLKESSSYEENFSKLGDTGFLTVRESFINKK